MMMMNARRAGAPLSAAIALVLCAVAGCGASEDSASSDDNTEQTASAFSAKCHHTKNSNIPRLQEELCTWKLSGCDQIDDGDTFCEKRQVCTGSYVIDNATYKFTENALGFDPARNKRANVTVIVVDGVRAAFRVDYAGRCGGA